MIFSCCERTPPRSAAPFRQQERHRVPRGARSRRRRRACRRSARCSCDCCTRRLHANYRQPAHHGRHAHSDRGHRMGGDRPILCRRRQSPASSTDVEELPRTLVIRTASSGDFSRYTLAIVANSGSDDPPADFDPLLSSIDFSFKVECPTDFDCDAPLPCAPAPALGAAHRLPRQGLRGLPPPHAGSLEPAGAGLEASARRRTWA